MKQRYRIYIVQVLLVVLYTAGSYQYLITWCAQNNFTFTTTEYLIYTAFNLLILLLAPLLNYFFLIDWFEKKGIGFWFYLLQTVLLFLSLYLHAALDAVFLARYKVPWLYTEVHVYSRFFINLSFMLLFGFQKLLLNGFRKKELENQLKLAQMEANIKMLRAQINPHFLFNTLNNIYSYAVQQRPETPALIVQLSGILRFLTDTAHVQSLVTAEKEIEVTKQLVDLYLVNQRWKEKLHFSVTGLSAFGKNFYIEPQSILTLTENAFKHSNLDEEEGFIDIAISLEEASLRVRVKNNIRAKEATGSDKTGLANLQQRLDITYGKKYHLDIQKQPGIFSVEMVLPNLTPNRHP
jgi:two-component system, LytTR family, sensor kinase